MLVNVLTSLEIYAVVQYISISIERIGIIDDYSLLFIVTSKKYIFEISLN